MKNFRVFFLFVWIFPFVCEEAVHCSGCRNKHGSTSMYHKRRHITCASSHTVSWSPNILVWWWSRPRLFPLVGFKLCSLAIVSTQWTTLLFGPPSEPHPLLAHPNITHFSEIIKGLEVGQPLDKLRVYTECFFALLWQRPGHTQHSNSTCMLPDCNTIHLTL